MPLEIEVKLKVQGHDVVREQLRAVGARHVGKVRETNMFFDRDGELRQKDSGLRVRLMKPFTGAGQVEALLTLKGPAATLGLRSREAFDVTVSPAEQMVPLLVGLGFAQVLLFEKDRESWEMEGCKVELDTMPVFGTFVEIEGPSEESVRGVQRKLALDALEPSTESYSKMVGRYVHEKRLASRALTFES